LFLIEFVVFRHGNEEEITKKYLEVRMKHKKIVEDMKKQKKFLSVTI
jgi:hypothetical protein